jgi:hypothetical protein
MDIVKSLIFLFVALLVIYSPIYLQRSKISRIADEDLKQIDIGEWKKQQKSNIFVRFTTRVIWGLFLLSGYYFKAQEIISMGLHPATVFVTLCGVGLIIWAFVRFRTELTNLKKIQ